MLPLRLIAITSNVLLLVFGYVAEHLSRFLSPYGIAATAPGLRN